MDVCDNEIGSRRFALIRDVHMALGYNIGFRGFQSPASSEELLKMPALLAKKRSFLLIVTMNSEIS